MRNYFAMISALLLTTGTRTGWCDDEFFQFLIKDIQGRAFNLANLRGKVTLVVNVASQCGYTDSHYKSLQRLTEQLKPSYFQIIAFPCNQFGEQEPGTSQEIQEFVSKNYGVSFPIMSKVDVIGTEAHPLWKYLTEKSGVSPNWNFFKYVVDHEGNILNVFPPQTSVQDMFDFLADTVRDAVYKREEL